MYTIYFFQVYSFQEESFKAFESSKLVDNKSDISAKRHSYQSTESDFNEYNREYPQENSLKSFNQTENTDDVLKEKKESFIREELNKLPENKRPTMRLALNNMQEGKLVFNAVEKGLFFDAIKNELWLKSDNSFAREYYEHINASMKILNSSDKNFWDIIKKDSKNKESFLSNIAKKLDVDEALLELLSSSPEYSMYFRLEYLHITLDSLSKKDLFFKMLEEAYLRSIAKMQWYFYEESILQGKIFTSGMITFKDKDQNCFKFLEGYVQLVSDGYRNKGFLSSIAQAKAYLRISSHYNGQVGLNEKQYGIDISEKIKKEIGLPVNKSHILFGMRDNGMIFIKWEDYGTTFNPLEKDYSAIPHTFNFLKKHGKVNGKLEFKESGSLELKNDFQKIYGKNLSEKDKNIIKVYGITGMHIILEKLPNETEEEKEFKNKKLEEFNKAFLKYFYPKDLDSIPYRKNQEVILNFDSNK